MENSLNATITTTLLKDFDIIEGGYIAFSDDNEHMSETISANITAVDYTKDEMLYYFLTGWDYWKHTINPTVVWGKMYKRELLEKIDWALCDFSFGEDDFFTLQALSKARSVKVVDAPIYHYRIRNDSLTYNKTTVFKYQSKEIEAFEIVLHFRRQAHQLLNRTHINEVNYALYRLLTYYLHLLLLKGTFTDYEFSSLSKVFDKVIDNLLCVEKHGINTQMLEKVKRYGAIGYFLFERDQLLRKDDMINNLQSELNTHLSIKRSARLLAGNIKRKLHLRTRVRAKLANLREREGNNEQRSEK